MDALIFCSLCNSIPAAGIWNYQNVGGVNKPVCHDCNKDLQEYLAKPFFQQLDVIDELLAEANITPPEQGGFIHDEPIDLNREHSDMDAAQPTTPPHGGESKATNE